MNNRHGVAARRAGKVRAAAVGAGGGDGQAAGRTATGTR
jgi:hypothetical protein